MTREEAINKVRQMSLPKETMDILEELVPELAMSEDERMIYELQGFLSSFGSDYFGTGEWQKFDDWLEKQKEQKEIPLMNGDADLYFDNWIQHNDTTKRGCFEEGIRYATRLLQKEQKPTEWSKNDAAFLNEITDFFESKTVILQHDLDMYTHWLKSLPERFVLQPKQEWSKEDEKYLNRLINFLVDVFGEDSDTVKWLKSLRPQPHTVSIKDATKFSNLEYERGIKDGIESEKSHQWKPSEEQMGMLLAVINEPNNAGAESCQLALKSLYEQLKKLM